MNNYTIISNKSRLPPINKPKYSASFLLSILTLIRKGKGRMVPCYVITYSNNPETKLHHVIKLDQ